jgi:hypothetical protein
MGIFSHQIVLPLGTVVVTLSAPVERGIKTEQEYHTWFCRYSLTASVGKAIDDLRPR